MPIVGAACGSTRAKLSGVTGERKPIPPIEFFGSLSACATAATASINAVASIVRFKVILLLEGPAGSSDRTRPNLGAFLLRTNRTKTGQGPRRHGLARTGAMGCEPRPRSDKHLHARPPRPRPTGSVAVEEVRHPPARARGGQFVAKLVHERLEPGTVLGEERCTDGRAIAGFIGTDRDRLGDAHVHRARAGGDRHGVVERVREAAREKARARALQDLRDPLRRELGAIVERGVEAREPLELCDARTIAAHAIGIGLRPLAHLATDLEQRAGPVAVQLAVALGERTLQALDDVGLCGEVAGARVGPLEPQLFALPLEQLDHERREAL